MTSIVFSKAFFKRSCKNFFTVKTCIIISLSVSFFIKWICILCSIHFPLSDSYTLLSLCTLTTANFVRFFKEFFILGWEIYTDVKHEFLHVKEPCESLNKQNKSFCRMTPSNKIGSTSRAEMDGSDFSHRKLKLNKMKSILDNKDFKTADKLKRLAEVENSVSDDSNSNNILQL